MDGGPVARLAISNEAYADIRQRIEDLAERLDPTYRWQYITRDGSIVLPQVALEPEDRSKLQPRE